MPDLAIVVQLGAVLLAAAVVFLGALWFGRSVVAPRISNALDRAAADEEESADRPD